MRAMIRNACALGCVILGAGALGDTVLAGGAAVDLPRTLADADDLWISTGDLTRATGFELKPEGACIDDICVPVRQDVDSDLFVRRQGEAWFNVTELADRLEQPWIADHEAGVWSFGAIPVREAAFHDRAVAPDFALEDLDGNAVRLSDFKGRKIALLTWASW